MPTRDEVTKLYALREEQGKKAQAANLALVRQAALKIDYVTKDEHWDYFLSILQTRLNEARDNEIDWTQKCAVANSESDWHIAQRNYFGWMERRKAIEEVMVLPRDLMSVTKETPQ